MGKMKGGGVESVVMNYYRHIDRQKVQFDFIIDADSTLVPQDEIESLGGCVYKIPPYQKLLAYHKALTCLLRTKNYHIVHSHINTLSVFSLFAAKRAGVPVRISHSHSTAGKDGFRRNLLKYVLRPFSRVFPTHFCACGADSAQWLFGRKAESTLIVKNAVDVSKFTFDAQVRQFMRKALDVEEKLVIGHVGRFMRQKNHAFLLDIFAQIRLQNLDSVLLLVGDGELEPEIRSQARQLDLSDDVRFLGVRDDVHALLQAMDVLLLPSLYEGLPVVGVEAQISGLPVAASSAITKEVKFTEAFMYLPLALSAQEWAKNTLSLSCGAREATTEQATAAGYDIKVAAEELLEFYENRTISFP